MATQFCSDQSIRIGNDMIVRVCICPRENPLGIYTSYLYKVLSNPIIKPKYNLPIRVVNGHLIIKAKRNYRNETLNGCLTIMYVTLGLPPIQLISGGFWARPTIQIYPVSSLMLWKPATSFIVVNGQTKSNFKCF